MTKKPLEIDWLRRATRFRYVFPVLAELQRDQGCKFVTLISRLDASDRAIRQALDYLIEIGWAMRNPGYGHPSRPEYILAPFGSTPGFRAIQIWDALSGWNEGDIALERWPLVVLNSLEHESKRFSEIRARCPSISPRALAMALTRLEGSGLATRTLVDGRPPTTEYSATNWGRTLLKS
ncbi:MAG: helix-turn-helix transcriptional regulator [Chlorobia bacterium]|nr:helix-turn-helix transcriptional regulator [Fimbriimonadaceae bacterium]